MASKTGEKVIIERPERFTLSGLHAVKFKVYLPSSDVNGVYSRLINLSSHGLAFDLATMETPLQKEQKLKAEITLDSELIHLNLNVRHLDAAVGCRIENADEKFRELVENFFINEMAAEQLVEVTCINTATNGGQLHQYVGSSNAFALSYVDKDGQITNVHLTLMGSTIKMDDQKQIEYGFYIEGLNPAPENIVHIKVQDLPDEMINHALRFIWNIQAVPANIKRTIMNMLEDSRHKKIA